MASKNETVAEISKEQHEFAVQVYGVNTAPSTKVWKLADRIAAAHNREILFERHLADEYLAAKDREIAELRERIKIAEDALDKIYKCIDNRYGVDASMLAKNIIADAIAAIRRKEEQ